MIEEDYVSFETAKLLKEKAAAYDEAIKRVEDIKTGKCETTFVFTEGLFEHIFPELKEDEDERIRKELYDFCIKCSHGDTLVNKQADFQKWATWLEKQCEQKRTTEIKSAEESLGIDSDTYNKIVDECIYGEQKSAEWSEEDIMRIDNLIAIIENRGYPDYVEYLEKLKYRVRPKQEWSEEDKEMLNLIISVFEVNHPNGYFKANELNDPNMRAVYTEEIVNWLKSLRPQNKWKPSEEQMKFLYKYAEQNNYDGAILTSLYKQLKQL